MIVKSGNVSSKQLLDGITIKNLAHSQITHLIEVRLEKGAIIPEHNHPQEQTGYLISGKLRFFSGEDEAIALPGDSWTFASSVMHGAEALEDTVVIEVFSPVRHDYLEL